MRVLLLCNPASGSGPDPDELRALLEGHGATVAEGDPDRVVVAGGDGSLGQAAAQAAERGVPLAVIPTGTANDFARAHGLPDDPQAAAELAVTGRHTVRLELADLDGRPFVNAASAGLAPAAARRAAPLKRLLGPLAYPAGAVLAGALEQPVACRTDGFAGRAWQVTVAATGAFGGGAEIGDADPADGLLDLVIIPAGPRLVLPRVGLALRRGEVAGVRRAARLLLEIPPGTPFNVDGEVVHAGPSACFSLRPGGFELVRQAR